MNNIKKCQYWNCGQEFIPKVKHQKYCCKKCSQCASVAIRRTELKLKAFYYKGGKCENCGFVGNPVSFDFHHIDPTQKDFAISTTGTTKSWERIKQEVDKCQLLCKNCHAEKHVNMTILSEASKRFEERAET